MNYHFANLDGPIWDGIRIPRRRTAREIGDEMCAAAGLDREVVRRKAHHSSAGVEPMVKRLQEDIAAAILDTGLTVEHARTWFLGFEASSIVRMAGTARQRRREGDA